MEQIRIGPDDAGQRLDRFVRKYLRGATLPTVYKLIRTRQVTVNGKRSRPERRLAEGDMLVIHPADRRVGELKGAGRQPMGAAPPELEVLHEDEHVLAVAKPPFLLVHPGRHEGEPTLLDGISAYLGPSGAMTFEPSLAHRLDRLTSGVVLVGKTADGLRGLTTALRKGRVTKDYLALSVGEIEADEGEIDVPLRREDLFESDRPRVRVDRGRGKRALTRYRVLSRHGGLTLLTVRLLTGRTHQIRAHLRHFGHPLLGDPTYGDREANRVMRGRHGLWRQWLHAFSVALLHPVTGRELRIRAPLPDDLFRVLDGEGFPPGALPRGATARR
ncbi:MAG: RluA family pseudouridine synthase [Planctomycetota bacterium]|jgi:23S rRNA pseudouridine955/2504/2580 synthase